jgi:hypothetical protein
MKGGGVGRNFVDSTMRNFCAFACAAVQLSFDNFPGE